jgi:hypothetical protein
MSSDMLLFSRRQACALMSQLELEMPVTNYLSAKIFFHFSVFQPFGGEVNC